MKRTLLAIASLAIVVGVSAADTTTAGLIKASTPGGATPTVVTQADGGAKLGNDYVATLYVGSSKDSLVPAFAISLNGPLTIPFFGNPGASATGRLNGKDATNTKGPDYELQGIAQGQAYWFQWAAYPKSFSDYNAAFNALAPVGKSEAVSVTTGGNGLIPPAVAAAINVPSWTVVAVPEPSVLALGVLGIGAFLLRRRM